MSSIALWIGVIIFGLGAIFGLLSGIRTLQVSRRWSDYRLRQRYIVQARGSVLLALFSGALAVALLFFARSTRPSAAPATQAPTPSRTSQATSSPFPQDPSPTGTASPTLVTPSETPVTPSPVEIPTLAPPTATPAMPIAVQAMIQGTVTPAFDVEFGRLRFSTEINNYTLVAPGEKFLNPIKQMYSVFTYQPLGIKVEWIALWYQNGALKYVDTTSWKDFPAGVAVAGWTRPAPEWDPGDYEVQIFLGTDWKASGRFVLEGNPPTLTPSPLPSDTPTRAPTATASSTPTASRTSTASPVVPPTHTPTASPVVPPTRTPTATSSATPVPTRTAVRLAAPSATPTRRATSTATFTATPRPSATSIPSNTATRAPSLTPTLTASPTITPTRLPVTLDIYFTNARPSGAALPAARSVRRQIAGTDNLMAAALDQYFAGPTIEEQRSGLELSRNGFAGYRKVEFANGVVSVYLSGNCTPSGNGYSLARPLIATLRQFPGVLYVKLYDAYDHTGNALSAADSWPTCLDVIFTLTPTASATFTPTLTPTASSTVTLTPTPTASSTLTPTFTPSTTPSATQVPTHTPLPTSTATPLPTLTPQPSNTPSPLPTRTPLPTATRTPVPSATNTPIPTATTTRTAQPTATFTRTASRTPTSTGTATLTRTPLPSSTPRPTLTPSLTLTPGPTWTPRPTLTLTPINAPTRTPSAASQSATAVMHTGPTPTLDSACNHVEFLGDVTIVDNATLRPGEAFRKTWRIQNAGNCSWTSAYRLVFVRGDRMGGPDEVPLPALVAPGQSADVSVDLMAPVTQGQYGGFWQLQTPGGTTFGIGPAGSGNLWVQIHVAGEPVATTTATGAALVPSVTPSGWAEATLTAFVSTQTAAAVPTSTEGIMTSPVEQSDLATNACAAQWQANDGILSCPGTEGDPRGLVSVLSQANLEDGTKGSVPTLLTIPSDGQDGYVLGLYPQYQVRPGDHFQVGAGCQLGAQLCSVLFRVSYLDTMGAAHDLWTVGEFLDGHHTDLDLDLSDLAGQQIRLVLSVSNLGGSDGDRALWVGPRIVSLPTSGVASSPTAKPARTAQPTATQAGSPTPHMAPASPTAIPPTPTPVTKPPIPQFYDSLVEFFRRLFSRH